MHDCTYCDESFDEEVELHRHWLAEHENELSSHKRDTAKRTVNKHEEQRKNSKHNEKQTYKMLGLIAIVIVAVIGSGYALMQTGVVSFDAAKPTASTGQPLGPPGSAHYHAQFEVVVEGQRVDFSQSQYQVVDRRAHFESRDGSTLHYHATGVPISYVFETFGWKMNSDTTEVLGETYSPETTTVTVNGQEVEQPWNYVANNGESISVRINPQNG